MKMLHNTDLWLRSGPLVTVVTPVRNRKNLTLRFLEAMSLQDYKPLEIVLVDSNSTDGTKNAIQSHFPDVVILPATDNHFWAGATNIGIRYALSRGSEWILTINDDAFFDHHLVSSLVSLACHKKCLVLGSQINLLADPETIWARGTSIKWGTPYFLSLCAHGTTESAENTRKGAACILPVDTLPGNGVLIHSNVFRCVGLYNDKLLPHYHADSEFVLRVNAAGIQPWVTPTVRIYNDFKPEQKLLAQHGLRGALKALFSKKSYLYLPALVYIFWKYCPSQQKQKTLRCLIKRLLNKFHSQDAYLSNH